MSKKYLFVVSLLTLVMMLVSACGAQPTADPGVQKTADAKVKEAEEAAAEKIAAAEEAADAKAAEAEKVLKEAEEKAAAAGDSGSEEVAAAQTAVAEALADAAEAKKVAQAEAQAAIQTAEAIAATAAKAPASDAMIPTELVICQAQEPDTLYIYGGNMLAGSHIQAALGMVNGFFTGADFDYQAAYGLTELPTIDNGGAVLNKVTVSPGDDIVYFDPETGTRMTDTTTLEEPLELDQIVITYKLVEGLVWEDGTPLTAEDFDLSWELYNDPDTPNPSRLSAERTAVFEMTDDSTQVVTLIPGFTPADYNSGAYFWTPLPSHVIGHLEPAAVVESEYARSITSFGPYKMDEWVPGQHIRVVRNENFIKAGEGYPKFEAVTYKFVPDTNQLLAQLISGECDLGTEDGMDMDQSPFLVQAEEQGILIPNYKRGTVWEHIDFGFASVDGRYQFFGAQGYTDLGEIDESDPESWVGTPAWEAAKKVRKAFAHCIDRQRMVDEALYGQSTVIHTFIPENHPMYPESGLIEYDYNIDKGMALLEEVGWVDSDGDNVRDRNGIKFEVTINTTSGNKMREIITQVTQENMKDCGLSVLIELMPSREYFGDGPDGPLFGRHYDLGEFAWLTGVEPPVNLYYCEQWPTEENGWAGQNNPGYCNPEFDAVGKLAEGTLSRAEQKPLFDEAQIIFSDDLPTLPLFQRVSVSAYRPGLLNYKPNPTINTAMWNIWEWGWEGQ